MGDDMTTLTLWAVDTHLLHTPTFVSVLKELRGISLIYLVTITGSPLGKMGCIEIFDISHQ